MIIRFWLFLGIVFSMQLYAQEKQILLADPTIFEENDTYYLYGTKEDQSIPGEGFLVYISKDLKNWEGPVGKTDGFALKKGDAFGTKGFGRRKSLNTRTNIIWRIPPTKILP